MTVTTRAGPRGHAQAARPAIPGPSRHRRTPARAAIRLPTSRMTGRGPSPTARRTPPCQSSLPLASGLPVASVSHGSPCRGLASVYTQVRERSRMIKSQACPVKPGPADCPRCLPQGGRGRACPGASLPEVLAVLESSAPHGAPGCMHLSAVQAGPPSWDAMAGVSLPAWRERLFRILAACGCRIWLRRTFVGDGLSGLRERVGAGNCVIACDLSRYF